MESTKTYYTNTNTFTSILKNTNFTIHSLILSFLDLQEITVIYHLQKEIGSENYFFQLAALKYLIMKYANRTDRSLFFIFYQEKQFINVQKEQFDNIAANHVPQFLELPSKFDQILDTFKQQLNEVEQPQQIIQSLETLIFEADLPLPKLKKETVAMYCQSTFQLFLSQIKFPNPEEVFLDPPLENLQAYIQTSLQTFFKTILQKAGIDSSNNNDKKKILIVRFCAQQITSKNYSQFLIQGLQLHNIIVCIFGLMDNLLKVSQKLVSFHTDPFMKFVEFCLRYSIYKNIIIGIEDHLGFLSQSYNKLFKNAFSQYTSEPQFRFWLPMMTRWLFTMKSYHKQLQQVYNYIVTRQRLQNLHKFVQGQMEKLPSIYNPVCTQLLKSEFLIEQKAQIYQNNEKCIQGFFEENTDLYDVVAKDYLEYVLDTSVNQISVHWCGSTNQRFPENAPFLAFNSSFLQYNLKFTENLHKIVSEKVPGTISFTVLKEMIQSDMDYMNSRLVKPFTGKQMFDNFITLMKTKIQNQPQLQIFSQQHMKKYRPNVDFNYQDNLLTYFNEKESIPETCPVSLSCFYNILNQMESNEILIRATKKYEQNLSQPSQTDQQFYISEQEDNNNNDNNNNDKQNNNVVQPVCKVVSKSTNDQ